MPAKLIHAGARGWGAVQGFQRRAALAETIADLEVLVEETRILDGPSNLAATDDEASAHTAPSGPALYRLID